MKFLTSEYHIFRIRTRRGLESVQDLIETRQDRVQSPYKTYLYSSKHRSRIKKSLRAALNEKFGPMRPTGCQFDMPVLEYIGYVSDSQSLLCGPQVVPEISSSGPRIHLKTNILCFADHHNSLSGNMLALIRDRSVENHVDEESKGI